MTGLAASRVELPDNEIWALTNELRFVNRNISVPIPGLGPDYAELKPVKVLQQKWTSIVDGGARWQDVPLVDEEP